MNCRSPCSPCFTALPHSLPEQLSRRLPGMTAAASAVYYDPGRHAASELARVPLEQLGGGHAGDRFRGLRALMHRLRWRKSGGELALMRRASALAEEGLLRCMRAAPRGLPTERHMAAEFEAHCRMGGAARMAYPPVVASGADACTIHYSRNDKVCCVCGGLEGEGGGGGSAAAPGLGTLPVRPTPPLCARFFGRSGSPSPTPETPEIRADAAVGGPGAV